MSAMSSEPAECPEPAASSERMMPSRTSLAFSSSSLRCCGGQGLHTARYTRGARD